MSIQDSHLLRDERAVGVGADPYADAATDAGCSSATPRRGAAHTRTGRPALRASAATIASRRTKVFAPNEPPIGGQTMRTCSSGKPKTPARSSRTLNGVCVPVQTLEPPIVPGGEGGMRLHRRVLSGRRPELVLDHHLRAPRSPPSLTMDDPEAVADVRSLFRAHAEVGGVVVRDLDALVHERRAGERLVDARGRPASSSYSTSMSPSASSAAASLSAATAATGSPAKRARSSASTV